MPQLTAWLSPRLRAGGLEKLKPRQFRDLCWDDSDWSRVLDKCVTADVEYHTSKLAEAIEPATIRAYHGCRTDDAGIYQREGLRTHDRAEMIARLQAVVDARPELKYFKDRLPDAIAAIENTLDIGALYVVADDQSLIKHAAHYLIYGSEWISAVLGHSYRHVLKTTGVPTLLEIDLPLRMGSLATRKELATKMLREWARLACNRPDWSAPIDFTFTLRTNVPSDWLVGHSHPGELVDPLEHYSTYRTPKPECAHCRAS
ncbi:hypothetical protein [Bradyrhizobium glycinis]|uniref:hypothetical protein n=1 Tax=Bradyrhizobium glycinis TaxID=2751812 RepID=UPI0018D830A9|nr:hypothetical protein [Bradyrhizobium glycinis]MBH5373519.1 hypothetical protein [Bradyrhizobium glycinis]